MLREFSNTHSTRERILQEPYSVQGKESYLPVLSNLGVAGWVKTTRLRFYLKGVLEKTEGEKMKARMLEEMEAQDTLK